MSRSTVIIDGVTLTRQQIEKAQEELNKPVEPTGYERMCALKPGDRFTYWYSDVTSFTYLVTQPIIGQRYFVVIDSGVVCQSTLQDLGRCYDQGKIILHPRLQ